jgi:hypothetical protein
MNESADLTRRGGLLPGSPDEPTLEHPSSPDMARLANAPIL